MVDTTINTTVAHTQAYQDEFEKTNKESGIKERSEWDDDDTQISIPLAQADVFDESVMSLPLAQEYQGLDEPDKPEEMKNKKDVLTIEQISIQLNKSDIEIYSESEEEDVVQKEENKNDENIDLTRENIIAKAKDIENMAIILISKCQNKFEYLKR